MKIPFRVSEPAEEKFLDEKEYSRATSRPLPTIRNERCQRRGVPHSKLGRSVRYKWSDILAFMEAHKVTFDKEDSVH